MFRKVFIIFLTITLLSGCFGGDDSTPDTPVSPTKNQYDGGNFTINYPLDWKVINRNEFTTGVPENTIVGFKNNIKNEIFTANVSITATNLNPNSNSIDFAKNTQALARSTLLDYRAIGSTPHTIQAPGKAVETVIAEFSGRKSPSEPILIFTQLYAVDNNLGYTVTGAYLPNEDESVVNYIDEMLKSFSLK